MKGQKRGAEVSHLARREAQAPLVSALIRGYAERMGEEEALEVAREVVRRDAVESGATLAEAYGDPSLETLLAVVKEVWAQDGTMEIANVDLTADGLSFDVTRCGYAEMYKRLGLQKLGVTLSCDRDFPFMDGFNPEFELRRSRTLMEGDDVCDFRYMRRRQP